MSNSVFTKGHLKEENIPRTTKPPAFITLQAYIYEVFFVSSISSQAHTNVTLAETHTLIN
jgi:hypothetical protein